MGKPATTYFCGNGHIMEDNQHHCYGNRDMADHAIPCQFCGSMKQIVVTEWHDPDYWGLDSDGQPLSDHPSVSHIPVRTDKVEREDHYGNIYYIDVPVYDISRHRQS